MANTIKIKRGSGSDPAASDMVLGEPVLRTDTAELFFKKDDGSVAKVSGGGGGPDFKYLALRNAANNGAASYPNADFTLVTSGTTNAKIVSAANTLLVSVNGVIQRPNTGTSTPSACFAISGSTIKFAANISAAPVFIVYQESGGIGEPSDETVSEAKLQVSNSPINGYFLSAQSGNTGGLTWAAPVATSCTGNSATATALATARAINGVNFDGTAAITVTAAASTLSGTTLNSSVVTSSLTSLGDLSGLTVTGDVVIADSIIHSGDTDTKIRFGAANEFSVETGGVERLELTGTETVFNDTGVDTDFRIEGDTNANLFKVDAGNDRVGIGTSSPQQVFHVYHAADNGLARFESGDANCRIDLVDNSGQVSIEAIGNQLSFGTSSSNTKRMRIDSSGNVGIGTTSPSTKLHVNGTVTATAYAGDGSNLTGISAGATGGGSDEIFYENSQAVTSDYTITSGKNAMSAGPITINNGVSVTVPSGSTYTIV